MSKKIANPGNSKQMTRRTKSKKIANPGNSKQMTRRTKCKKIAARKTHEVFKTGASECAHTCRWLRVLPVVPLPAPIPRYSEPSGDAGRLPPAPASLPTPARARPGGESKRNEDRAKRGQKRRNSRRPGGSQRELHQTGRRTQIPNQHGICKPNPDSKQPGGAQN